MAHKESDKRYQRKPFQYKPIKPVADEKLHETGKSGEASQKQEKRKCFVCDSTEHFIATCPFKVNKEKSIAETSNRPRQANSLLYSPKKQQHKGRTLEIPVVPKCTETETELTNGLKIMEGFVDNKPVKILRDTGCTAIFISEQLVDISMTSLHEKDVTLADGTVRKCKEVQVQIDTPYICGIVDALVMSNPFADLVIGNIGHVVGLPRLQKIENVYTTCHTRHASVYTHPYGTLLQIYRKMINK